MSVCVHGVCVCVCVCVSVCVYVGLSEQSRLDDRSRSS